MVEMNKVMLKDTMGVMRKSFGRFFSILAIVALGVAFLAGIKVTAPMMRDTFDGYMDTYQMMDIQLLSTLGFEASDVEALREETGIQGIYPGYWVDTLTTVGENELVVKLKGMPFERMAQTDDDYLNQVHVLEGRLPQAANEAVILIDSFSPVLAQVGESVTFKSGTDTDLLESVSETTYTIVGHVQTPYFIHYEKGTSSIGNGRVASIVYIPDTTFTMPAYTEIFLSVAGAKELGTYSEAYDTLIDTTKERLEAFIEARATLRYENILADASEQLAEGEATYEEEKAKVYDQLEEARQLIEDGKVALAEGEAELIQGRQDRKSVV